MEKVNVIINEDSISRDYKEKYENNQEIKSKKNQFSIFIIFLNITSIISFSGLFILSWLSLFWLHKYHFVFTFYRYEKTESTGIEYFPIQVNSSFLYSIIYFTLLSITITYIIYIRSIIHYRNFNILNDKNKNYIIPISINLFLFYIGELTHNKSDIFHIYYFIGFIASVISLFYLIKLCYDFDNENDHLDFNNYIKNTFIYEFFYGALISLDLYYSFYVSCQIIFIFTESIEIKVYMGITVNFFMGLVGIYISFKLRNMVIALLFDIIYNGIIIYHFNFTENERKNIHLNSMEVVLSIMFIIGFLIEMIYIFKFKRIKKYYG